MELDDFFKRILAPDAGSRFIEELERRDRRRWERNASRLKRTNNVKLTSKMLNATITR